MYMHIVMMEFTPEAGPAFFAQVQVFGTRIVQECRGVQLYHFGANEADRSSGYSHAVVSVFESASDHDRYQVSPVHLEMKAYMGPLIQRIAVYDGAALPS